MTSRWTSPDVLVQKHYKFVSLEPPVSLDQFYPEPWHGPINLRRIFTAARKSLTNFEKGTWWRMQEDEGEKSSNPGSKLKGDEKNSGEFLLQIFHEPSPIALGIVQHLNVADIHNLMYVCKGYWTALKGISNEAADGRIEEGEIQEDNNNNEDGDENGNKENIDRGDEKKAVTKIIDDNFGWRWMLRKIEFGDERAGAADVFKRLKVRRPSEPRKPFWGSKNIQIAISNFRIADTLVCVNLDRTNIEAHTVGWLIENHNKLESISIRHCQDMRLKPLETTLSKLAARSKEWRVRLSFIYIDYWDIPEINNVVGAMLTNDADVDDMQHVADRIRYISRVVDSDVFLCIRNHEGAGICERDMEDFREVFGPEAVLGTFYPCEIKSIWCSLCRRRFERRLCLKCWATQICSYCKEYHCPNCEPSSYIAVPSYPSGIGHPDGALADLGLKRHCCSEIRQHYDVQHYFHPECWQEARPLTSCKKCDKFICWTIPSICCVHCRKRQCPNTNGYDTRMCQVCDLDYSYEGDIIAKQPSSREEAANL